MDVHRPGLCDKARCHDRDWAQRLEDRQRIGARSYQPRKARQAREVCGLDRGMREQVVHDRGHRGEGHDALLADPLGQARRVEAVHGDATASRLERHQRSERHQIENAERQTHTQANLGAIRAALGRDRSRQEQVVLAVHGALGKACGSAGVGDRGGSEGVHRYLWV